jgi:copper chaperone NosL
MRRSITVGGILAAGLAASTGCGRGDLEPASLAVDRAQCARCGMIVSDPRTAAQAVRRDEDPRFYDDVGCLAADREADGGGWELYVEAGGAWVRAREAFYARPEDARTPMGYGFLAFGSRSGAESRDPQKRARAWEEVVRHVRADATDSHGAS